MRSLTLSLLISLLLLFNLSCKQKMNAEDLKTEIRSVLSAQPGVFAVAFKNLDNGETILLNEKEVFHAASTMKTPVMMELFRQEAAGEFTMKDSMLIKNEFRSIVDSSVYQLDSADDSEKLLYTKVGSSRTIYQLMYDMIIVSSNLATNMLIEKAGAPRVNQHLRNMGINDMQVLRGVEDSKAFEKGLNNTATAYDLMLVFEQIGLGKAVNKAASDSMIDILLDQHFKEIIPAGLPVTVKVAHKTGSITGVQHDSGIVMLPDGRKYVLVLLSKKLEDEKSGIKAMAKVSELIYQHVVGN